MGNVVRGVVQGNNIIEGELPVFRIDIRLNTAYSITHSARYLTTSKSEYEGKYIFE